MKILILIVVVVFVLWLMFGRGRRTDTIARRKGKSRDAAPVEMVACAHCGVHLPRLDALEDAARRPYCGEAHRVAGPG